jgi:hypothetical protein
LAEIIEIGSSPCDEESAQVGQPDYPERSRAECKAFINQIKRALGDPPEGVTLYTKSNPHDLGTYREVAAKVHALGATSREEALGYAYRCEGESPAVWDDEARAELAEAGFPVPVQD